MGENNVLKEEEIKELLKGTTNEERIEKESAISWDGRNLMIRIPKEIADYLKINEKNRFEKSFKFEIKIDKDNIQKTFEITERTKPVKENKQNDNIKTTNKKKNKLNRQ
jgi:hypothetical protein